VRKARAAAVSWSGFTPWIASGPGRIVVLMIPAQTGQQSLMKVQFMKHLAITFFAITAFAVGCKPSGEQNQKTTTEQFEKVKKETKEAAQDMKNYAFAQKDEFVSKMQSQMAAINQDLDQLMARVEKSSDAAKAEARPKLQALRDQAAKLNKQLDEARNATESTWDSISAGFKKGFEEFKGGFNSARQWVSDKIAP
jgi:polyhydroxyalkanoate synthesis regulator phasin